MGGSQGGEGGVQRSGGGGAVGGLDMVEMKWEKVMRIEGSEEEEGVSDGYHNRRHFWTGAWSMAKAGWFMDPSHQVLGIPTRCYRETLLIEY